MTMVCVQFYNTLCNALDNGKELRGISQEIGDWFSSVLTFEYP